MINKSSMFVFLSTTRMYEWKLMLCTAATVLVLGCKFYESSFKVPTIWFTYDYEGASKGLSPNGSRFNAYKIKSEKVLRWALALAGVTEVTPEKPGEHTTIQVPAKNGRDYIATQYKVTHTANGDLASVDVRFALQMAAYAYLEYFYANYTDNLSVLRYEPADLEGLEHRRIASYCNTKLTQLKNYVNGKVDGNKSFISDDGITFQNIEARIGGLLQIDPANFRSFVTEKGVYKNRQAYVGLLDYKDYKDRNTYSINTKTYGLCKSYIDRYDPKMTRVVLVPSVDKDQDFYMPKTKAGINYLAEYAVGAEEMAEKKQSDIKNRQPIVDHISVSANQAGDLTETGGVIQTIGLELRDISRQAVQIDMEYPRYKNKDYVTVKDNEVGPLTRMGFVRAVIIGATFITMTAIAVMHDEEKCDTRGDGK